MAKLTKAQLEQHIVELQIKLRKALDDNEGLNVELENVPHYSDVKHLEAQVEKLQKEIDSDNETIDDLNKELDRFQNLDYNGVGSLVEKWFELYDKTDRTRFDEIDMLNLRDSIRAGLSELKEAFS